MEQDPNTTQPVRSRYGRALKGCAITTAIVLIAFIALLVYLMRVPSFRTMVECKPHMTDIGEALQRYKDVNGVYPPTLEALKSEYLPSAALLKCPEDKTPGPASSYVYHQPPPDAPDSFVILECRRHEPVPGAGHFILKLKVDGDIEVVSPPPPAPKPKGSQKV